MIVGLRVKYIYRQFQKLNMHIPVMEVLGSFVFLHIIICYYYYYYYYCLMILTKNKFILHEVYLMQINTETAK